MPTQTKHSKSALAYAKALLELADERKLTQHIAEELRGLRQVFAETPSLKAFFSSPGVADADRAGVLKSAFLPRLSPLLGSVVELLDAKGKVHELPDISAAYDELLDERLGKVEVEVTVAKKLSPQELDVVRQRISTAIKREAVVEQQVDESIIGGIVIRVGDALLDGSVKAQLSEMSKRLSVAR
ncbi:MAG: ATP synthase F1 subunit delta [Tepidisphaeraceae bacterium]